jgi:quinol monooxygenase YgiN
MAKQAVVVRYKVKPGKMDEFLPILRRHVADTKAGESGCLQFDILLPHDGEEGFVHLYEVYADEAAFRSHNASAALARYKSETAALLDERSITWCTVEE